MPDVSLLYYVFEIIPNKEWAKTQTNKIILSRHKNFFEVHLNQTVNKFYYSDLLYRASIQSTRLGNVIVYICQID